METMHKVFAILLIIFCCSDSLSAQQQNKEPISDALGTFSELLNQMKELNSLTDSAAMHQKVEEVLGTTVFFLNFGDKTRAARNHELAREEVLRLERYFDTKDHSKLTLRAIDSVTDVNVYKAVSPEIKSWIFALDEAGATQNPLLYFLFVPGKYIKQEKARILSWKLCYLFGQYHFEDAACQVGTEGFFKNLPVGQSQRN